MFNSIKTSEELMKEVVFSLKNDVNYFAHPTPLNTNKPNETLHKHIQLVQKKLILLINVHKIDGIIDELIFSLFDENQLKFNEDVACFLKKLWINTIVFHDYGKVNENFQVEKMKNSYFKNIPNSPLKTHHSALGAYFYLIKQLQDSLAFDEVYDNLVCACIFSFSYSIFKHHSKFLHDNIFEKVRFSDVEVDFMQNYIELYDFNIDDETINDLKDINTKFYQNKDFLKIFNSFSLYSLVRLNFSMLTASDFLASGEYCSNIIINDFGVLNKERVDEIYEFVTQKDKKKNGSFNFNKSTFEKANSSYLFQTPRAQSNDNLNVLRQEMGINLLQNIQKNYQSNLFYIEAPTGGGKTNLSFLATIELLKRNQNLNKVFYVFPFTTLVTQTNESLIDTFGLSSDEAIMLSSKSGFKEKEEQEENEDGIYGNQKKYYLDNLFCFFPFCLLTHIKFFDILKTNEKQTNYLLHRLANSIVIIDELQAYSPKEWDKVIYFIKNYAHFYNIKFIVMSATLPKIGNLKIEGLKQDDFVYLIDDAKERYFQNPNFSNRVYFQFLEEKMDLEQLADIVFEKSKNYVEEDFGDAKPKGSVYTIIEFIFKKSASEFYQIIEKQNNFFDEIFVLSGTILEHRRKYIIDFLKNKENRKKKILLITTQVVEAGVDIDMDLGFKDKSLIDSEEQLAGRINRNVNKRNCVLYLFNYNNDKIIYGKDKRYEITNRLPSEEYLNLLKSKDFDSVYNQIVAKINSWNETEMAIGFKDSYEEHIKNLRFQSVHQEFQLISKEQKNLAVFIPLEIENQHFLQNELKLLQENQICIDDKVKGSEVFDLYLDLIDSKINITIKQIQLKIMQGIMSKFTIQLIGSKKMETQLVEFQDVDKSDKGYIYLSGWNRNKEEPLYDEKFGINEKSFDAIETQFL